LRKKKWLIVALAMPLLALLLLHTQPVERAVWRRVAAEAQKFGVTLEASRFDLNLFTLSVSIRDLSLKHEAVEADVARLTANGRFGLFFGEIALDSFAVADGDVRIKPAPAETEPAPDPQPFRLPPIQLGSGKIDRVAVHFLDQTADFSAEDLRLEIVDGAIDLGLRAPETAMGETVIPEMSLALSARTAEFQRFDDVRLSLRSRESQLLVSGRIESGWAPHLEANLAVGPDLPLGFPLSMEAALTPETLSVQAVATPELAGEATPLRLSTQFRHVDEPRVIPIDLQLGDWGSGRLIARESGGDLEGELTLNGAVEKINGLLPVLDLTSAEVTARFAAPGLRFDRATAEAAVAARGVQSLDLSANWRDGRARFQGEAAVLEGSTIQLNGAYDGRLTVALESWLHGVEDLRGYIPLPEEVCSGPVHLSLNGRLDDHGWMVDDLKLQAQKAAYEPFLEDDVWLQANGRLDQLEGVILTQALNPDEAAVRFTFDALGLEWRAISLKLDTRPIALAGHDFRVKAAAIGYGPAALPAFNGMTDVAVERGGDPIARVMGWFDLKESKLGVTKLEAVSGHGTLTGKGNVALAQPLAWDADLLLDMRNNPEFAQIEGLSLPRFSVELKGDQETMNARILIPDQVYGLYDARLPIASDPDNRAVFYPEEGTVEGMLPRLEAGGLVLSDLTFGMSDGRVHGQLSYKLREPDMLQASLAAFWPEALTLGAAEGFAAFESDLRFQAPEASLNIVQLQGGYSGETFETGGVAVRYRDGALAMEPFTLTFAGVRAELRNAPPREGAPSALAVMADFTLEDGARLKQFLRDSWPEEFDLLALKGEASFYDDLSFQHPEFAFALRELKADYDGRAIESDLLEGAYRDGLELGPGAIRLGTLDAAVSLRKDGFALTAEPTADDIGEWLPGFVGDARFNLIATWRNTDSYPDIKVNLRQTEGRLIRQDPWTELSDWQIRIVSNGVGRYQLAEATGKLNGGNVVLEGSVDLTAEPVDLALSAFAEQIEVDLVDYRATLDAAVELTYNGQAKQVRSSAFIQDAYLNPKLELRALVEDLIAETPELYFPDPFLEEIQLEAFINSRQPHPIILESALGYVELETRGLVIKGNLASPEIDNGMIVINEGSYLDLGRRSFIFNPSLVQFHANQPGDPYLQISLRSSEPEDKNQITLNGYVSDLDHNITSTNVLGIVGSYLLGNVFSYVSLEADSSSTLFDSAYTLVVSERFSRKVVARYAYPVLGDIQEYAELNLGPFQNNFLNLNTREEVPFGMGLRHSRKWGYVDEQRPQLIKRIQFDIDERPPWLKRRFKLKRGDIYSQTFWRRAKLDLERQFRRRGYLNAQIEHEYLDDKLTVAIDQGRRTQLFVEGIQLSDDEKQELLTYLRDTSEASLRNVGLQVQRIALSRGFTSAAAVASTRDEDVYINVFLGVKLDDARVGFGKADPILRDIYSEKETRRDLLVTFLSDPAEVRGLLRANLAAKGYLEPEFGDDAGFRGVDKLTIPIEPGPRALLSRIYALEDGTERQLDLGLAGKPFDYTMIAQATGLLQRDNPGARISVAPRRDGLNVALEATIVKTVDPTVASLDIQGNQRIPDKKIERFLDFEADMPQSALVRSQKRLVEAGQFRIARLQTAEEKAVLEVAERNRYDADVEVTWSQEQEFGYGLQFKDYQMFDGFNRLAVNLRRTSEEEGVVARTEFLRVLGAPFDLSVGVDWSRDLVDSSPGTLFQDFLEFRFFDLQERRKLDASIGYPIDEHQRLSLGAAFRENLSDRRLELAGAEGVAPIVLPGFARFRLLPIQASWIYRRFDHPTSPRSGALVIFTADQYLSGVSDEDFVGTRLNGRVTYFRSWGPLLWTQRLELGQYIRSAEDPNPFPDTADISPLFFLGTANDVRGFTENLLGPNDGQDPIGGEAMFFASQELSIDLGYFGLGLSPFVDSGFVWEKRDDFFETDPVITGGIGLYWNSPIGYFRIDWARPLDDRSFEAGLEGLTLRQQEDLRNRALSEFSFRFGRVF